MFKLNKINLSGKNVLPIIEGGKGIAISTGVTAGAFAHAGAVGTISGTNPDYYDVNGNLVRYYFDPKWTRKEKFDHLVQYSIKGCIDQIKIATDIASGKGRIHINFLWEAGGTKYIMEEVLAKVKNLVHGVTAGAGLPYTLSEICNRHNTYYYPIISSARAFQILWKRAYNKFSSLLGGVVYEDPWLAGGHNGLSNSEDPKVFQDPYPRLVALRKALTELKLNHVPIVMAGGVWRISDWSHYLNNPEIGKIVFQFGTRPLLTKESPISDAWKKRLLTLKEGDVFLNKFSPTGFYSSAVNNDFLRELEKRKSTEMLVERKPTLECTEAIQPANALKAIYVRKEDHARALAYIAEGRDTFMRTPAKTAIFTTAENAEQIKADQVGCMGCLSACRFSGWSDHAEGNTTGILPDPTSFCIEKTLQDVSHGGDIDNNLLFSGHQAYRFAQDDLYANEHIPTIKELVERICEGK